MTPSNSIHPFPRTGVASLATGWNAPVTLAGKMEGWRRCLTPRPQYDEYGELDADIDSGLHLLPDHDEMTAVVRRRSSRPDEWFCGIGAEPELSVKKNSFAMLWQGFRHRWKKLPHRLNRLGSLIRDVVFRRNSRTLFAMHESTLQVGAYNDTGLVNTRALAVQSTALKFAYGCVDDSRLKVAGKVGGRATVRVRQSVDLKTMGLQNCEKVTVVVNGFKLKSESYQKGYNTRGFGVRVIPVGRDGDIFEFDAEFSVHPEHAPDRPQPDDYFWRGTHCQEYVYGAEIHYALIGVITGQGAITDAENGGTVNDSIAVRGFETPTPPRLNPLVTQHRFGGVPGFRNAILGVQGFDWHLEPWKRTRKDGRYIRELEFMVNKVSYDSAVGATDFSADMYYSNASRISFGYSVVYSMWNALIQTNDADFASTPIDAGGEIGRGQSRLTSRLKLRTHETPGAYNPIP